MCLNNRVFLGRVVEEEVVEEEVVEEEVVIEEHILLPPEPSLAMPGVCRRCFAGSLTFRLDHSRALAWGMSDVLCWTFCCSLPKDTSSEAVAAVNP